MDAIKLLSMSLIALSVALVAHRYEHHSNDESVNATPGKITRYACSDYFEPESFFVDWDSCEITIYTK